MTKTSVPATIPAKKPPPVILSEAHKDGYNFFNDRWEGDCNYETARQVALYWQGKGWTSNVHEDKTKAWNFKAQKHLETVWFRVYLIHPDDKDLYAWWLPTEADWYEEPEVALMTWFELVKVGDKK